MNFHKSFFLLILFAFFFNESFSQVFPVGFGNLQEKNRLDQLLDTTFKDRFVKSSSLFILDKINSEFILEVLPVYSISKVNSKRPYGANDYQLIPGVGFQQYLSTGFFAKWNFISLQLQPEFSFSQNNSYYGFPDSFSESIIEDKFFHWNNGDFPERFGEKAFFNSWWGQSRLAFGFGSFEIGASTQNIWWGPGQWNSLTFSNNAQGFAHFTFNTAKPAKTFLGYFETQLIMGKLNSSGFLPSQNSELNSNFAAPLSDDRRYLNALMVSYNPKWIPNIFLGFARTFQVYDSFKGNSFYDWFPVFEAFQKKIFFENGNTVDFDSNGRDQQMIIFGRYLIPKAKFEFYFEYGRRDHAFSWREFTLNPEHARAFILGFNKLFPSPIQNKIFKVRGEITQQQESINRLVRYSGEGGHFSWHMHKRARGFTNYGQGLGVGIGQGGNVQTLEISLVEEYDKFGVLFERLENNQGFYYRSFYESSENKPWIDFSLGFLYDKKFNNLLLSSKLQIIHARNYQWQLDPSSTPDFPKGKNLTSVLAQASLVYFWNKHSDNK